MEKLTAEDCNAIEFLKMAFKPKGPGIFEQIRGSVGIQYQGKTLYIKSHTDECKVGEVPRVTIHEDVMQPPCMGGIDLLISILERVGIYDLDNRIKKVRQEKLWKTWGGREEYEEIFFWLKDGKEHSDADWVDNTCVECGNRGLEKFEQICGNCRKGD